MEFADKHLQKVFGIVETVLFADERKFNVIGSDGRTNYVWRKSGEKLREKQFVSSDKIRWWGCMAEPGVGNSHFIEGIMNKHIYANGL